MANKSRSKTLFNADHCCLRPTKISKVAGRSAFFCIVLLATIYISGLEKNQPYRETSLLSKAQQEEMKTMDAAAGVFELFEDILSTHCSIP